MPWPRPVRIAFVIARLSLGMVAVIVTATSGDEVTKILSAVVALVVLGLEWRHRWTTF